jgi:hypothetical protein
MWDTAAFAAGFLLITAGALSLLYPVRWIGIKTRAAALMVISGGFLVVALAARWLDSYLVYLGLTLAFLGLVSVFHPLRSLHIRSPRAAVLVAAFGATLAVGMALLPYTEKHAASVATKLDDWMERWQVGEKHTIEVAAPPDKVFAAVRGVRADEITLFKTLTAIRRCGQDGPENILNAPDQKPLLDVATETTFVLLAEDAPREIVVGTVIAAPASKGEAFNLGPELFRRRLEPGTVLATMNFVVEPNANGSNVTTETRVYASSTGALRRFSVYWRLIHPGSDLIRRMWLRAIAQRAERPQAPGKQ